MPLSPRAKTLLVILGLCLAAAAGYLAGTPGHEQADRPAAREVTSDAAVKYTCSMHPFIVRDAPGLCPICGMELTPLKDGGEGAIAVDPVTRQSMGVRTAAAGVRDLQRSLRAVGLVAIDEAHQYVLTSKVDGWIEKLHVNQSGQPVRKGQALLEIYSPDLVAAQHEYLLALQNSRRQADNPYPGMADGARRLLDAARSRLLYWDISATQIAHLEQSGEVRKTLTLYSPYGGFVTMKKAVQGMRVMAGEELLQVADLSRVWVNAEIYEQDLPWVRVGQQARVELPYAPGRVLDGEVDYLYPYLAGETRTARARIVLANPGLELKPEMYANVMIATAARRGVLVIPADAVLHSGERSAVFVARGDGSFEPRPVTTGAVGDDGFVEILSGLTAGEQVVTSAQFMLDSESRLREAFAKMTAPGPALPASGAAPPAATPARPLDDLFK